MGIYTLKIKIEEIINKEVYNLSIATEGYQNIVAIFEAEKRKYVVRITDYTKRKKESIEFELNWIELLSNNNVTVSKPVIWSNERIHPLLLDSRLYWAVFFQHSNGIPVNVSDKNVWNKDLFYYWGQMIAKIHLTEELSSGQENLRTNEWIIPSINLKEPWLQIRYNELMNKISRFAKTGGNYGIIHNDLHQGNFHLRKREIVLFDFDNCGYNFYAQDLAVSIYHAVWTGTSFHPDWKDFPVYFLEQFLNGYCSLKTLTEDMYTQIVLFLQFRELFLYILFTEKWKQEQLTEWQTIKLEDLKYNVQHSIVPYQEELEKVYIYFSKP